MGFGSTSLADLRFHLESLKVRSGGRFVVHSSLLSFGKVEGGAVTILRLLREMVGPRGTIFVPTFTLHLDSQTTFDPKQTPPQAMGALADLIWRLDDSERSCSPLHSYAGIGADKKLVRQAAHDRSFGKSTFFDLAAREDFYWVMLGCPIDTGCPLLHHAESEVGVPYREPVSFKRHVLVDGQPRDIDYRYYGRKSSDVDNDFVPIRTAMVGSSEMISVPARHGESLAAFSTALMRNAVDMMQRDPRALLRKPRPEAARA